MSLPFEDLVFASPAGTSQGAGPLDPESLSVSTPPSKSEQTSLNALRTLFGVKDVQKNGPFLRRSLISTVSSGNGGSGLMKRPSFGLLRNNEMQLSSTDASLIRTKKKNFFHKLKLEVNPLIPDI